MDSIGCEIIISTCQKFSDLWEANVLLLNRNWKDRGMKTWLVTDEPVERELNGVELVCAGTDTEITQRLETALHRITSKYILLTLDDYFLTVPIDSRAIQYALSVMEAEDLDYLRLLPATPGNLRREGAVEFSEYPGFFLRDVHTGNYKISLCPGIWRTDFMRKTLGTVRNAWEYEVSLTPMAREMNARCAISNHNEFPYLDVVRKGKILRKADRYFRKDPILQTDRKVMSAAEDFKFALRGKLHYWLPKPLLNLLKRLLGKLGMKFYSPAN